MFVFEHIKKKNFLNRKRNEKTNLKTNTVEEENLERFKEEISNEIGVTLKKEEDQ